MHYMPSEIIDASKNQQMTAMAFGLPIAEYPYHGSVVMPQVSDSYDYLAVSECRACGGLITTLAMDDGGALMPMSAGSGPECSTDRCGDKVSAICYAVYEIVDAPAEMDSARQDDPEEANSARKLIADRQRLLELAKLMNFMRLDYLENHVLMAENLTDDMMSRLALFHSAISSVNEASNFVEEVDCEGRF